jgi:hypothetical protein
MSPLYLLLLLPVLPQETVPSSDSIYSSQRLRKIVEKAAVAHSRPSEMLAAFTAIVESEISTLIRNAEGQELPTQVEQFAGHVAWGSGGRLVQELTGYRGRFEGLTFSVLSYLKVPWVIAPLYGDRVSVGFAPDSVDVSARDSTSGGRERMPVSGTPGEKRRGETKLMVHPFATDREEHYRFSGGDTVLVLHLPDRTVPLVRLLVEPVGFPQEELLFQGEIDLDATRHQIVRMRGRVLRPASPSSPLFRLLGAALRTYFFLDLENAEWEGSVWLPHRQRMEIGVESIFSDEQVVLRIVTDFSEVMLNPAEASDPSDTLVSPLIRTLRVTAMDSLRAFRGWRAELGATTAERNMDDFDDVAPESLRSTGPPRLRVGTGSFSDALRFDRVEGMFTGLGIRLDLRDAAPGGFIGFNGGYAWAESTSRGKVEAGIRRPGWEVGVAAERRLASTNDFPRAFGAGPSILGLLGLDDFDYVDRRSAELRVGLLGEEGETLYLEGGAVSDRMPIRHVYWDSFREIRPVHPGSYAHLLLRATAGENSGGEFLSPGASAAVSWELARGQLNWQRVEAVIRARRQRSQWRLAGEMHVGFVRSDHPPPQVLFELGSMVGRLPGFEYKAFSGDRAAVVALQFMYVPPIFDEPIRFWPLFLPAFSPSPSLQLNAGWTGASAAAAALMENLGWEESNGIRSTLFLGFRLFGGALGLGIARPLDGTEGWRFEWGLTSGA